MHLFPKSGTPNDIQVSVCLSVDLFVSYRYFEVSCGLSVNGYRPRHGVLRWWWRWGILTKNELQMFRVSYVIYIKINIKPLWPTSMWHFNVKIVEELSWTLKNCTPCGHSLSNTYESQNELARSNGDGLLLSSFHSVNLKLPQNGHAKIIMVIE